MRETIEREVVGRSRMCLSPTVAGGPTVFWADVGIEVGHGAAEAKRERRGGPRQGALAGVQAPDEQHRACLARGSIDEPIVLVHCARSVPTEVGLDASASERVTRPQPASVYRSIR